MLTKLMTVGCLGVFASMGLLLYTLKFVEQEVKNTKPTPLSPLAFQSLLRQGEILECKADGNGLVGLRRGRRKGRKVAFSVQGPLSKRLIRELARRKMLQPAAEPKSKVASRPPKGAGPKAPAGVGAKPPARFGTQHSATDNRKVPGPLRPNTAVEVPVSAPKQPKQPKK